MNSPQELINSGLALFHKQKFNEALEHFKKTKTLTDDPNSINPNFSLYLGACYLSLEKIELAIKNLNDAIKINPNSDASYQNLGIAYKKQNQELKALEAFEKVLSCEGRKKDLGIREEVIKLAFDNYLHDKAYLYADQYLQWDKDNAFCLRYKAKVFEAKGQIPKAIFFTKKIIELKPDNDNYKHLLGILYFRAGKLPESWDFCEFRWQNPILTPIKESMKEFTEWNFKDDLNGKKLFIHVEQGFGDVFNFFRYIIKLKETFPDCHIIYFSYDKVIPLLQYSYDKIQYEVYKPDEPFDYWIPLLSIPKYFRTTAETIFLKDAYIKAPKKIFPFSNTDPAIPKIGICWQGNKEHHNDKNRSINLEQWENIISSAKAHFVSLQFGETEAQIDQFPWAKKIQKTSHLIKDWLDTAQIIQELDCIISIDSAIAHLAGAMGKKTLAFIPCNPDWRWGQHNTEIQWYNSMTLIRQNDYFQWQDALQKVQNIITQKKIPLNHKTELNEDYSLSKHFLKLLEQAGKAIQEKNYSKALDLLLRTKRNHLTSPLNNILFHIGTCYLHLKKYRDAIYFLKKEINENKENEHAYKNLSIAYRDDGQELKALEIMNKSLSLPMGKKNINLKGEILRLLLRNYLFSELLETSEKFLQENPSDYLFLRYKAKAFEAKGLIGKAIAITKKRIQLKENNSSAYFLLGLLSFKIGDLPQAWQYCEHRWSNHELKPLKEKFLQSIQWTTQIPLNHKTLLIHFEQGNGDIFQFFRYIIKIKTEHPLAKIILVVYESLISILKSSYDQIEYIPYEKKAPLSYDFWLPYLSLPYCFQSTIDTIPKTPYLKAQKNQKFSFISRSPLLKVGFSWQGNKEHHNDKNRSIPLKHWQNLIDKSNADFFSLQIGNGRIGENQDLINKEINQSTLSWTNKIQPLNSYINDWRDTAEIIQELDCVICIDSALAHLAGALGKKTFLLLPCNPDWRWGLKESEILWYQSTTIIRQEQFFQWEKPLEKIQKLLLEFKKILTISSTQELFQQGQTHMKEKNYDLAFEYFQAVLLKTEKANPELFLCLAENYLKRENFSIALYYLKKAAQDHPKTQTLLKEAAKQKKHFEQTHSFEK